MSHSPVTVPVCYAIAPQQLLLVDAARDWDADKKKLKRNINILTNKKTPASSR